MSYISANSYSSTPSSLFARKSDEDETEAKNGRPSVKQVMDGQKAARASANNAKLAEDETKLEVTNFGNGKDATFEVNRYKKLVTGMTYAIQSMAKGDDAKNYANSSVLKLLGGETETGDEMVDTILQSVLTTQTDGTKSQAAFYVPTVNGTAGDDVMAANADGGSIVGARTGDGADWLQLTGGTVVDVNTDADAKITVSRTVNGEKRESTTEVSYSNDDLLEVSAEVASGLKTGGGNDTMYVDADYATDVSGGDGNDYVRVRADYASGVDGGAGNDAVAVEAVVVGNISGGSGDDIITVSAQTTAGYDQMVRASDPVEQRMRSALSASEVSGGEGDDKMVVGVAGGVAVSGGEGDDEITLVGGTVALKRNAGDGTDVVTLKGDVDVVIAAEPTDVEMVDDMMFVSFEDGGMMVFENVSEAGSIAFASDDGSLTFLKKAEQVDHRI